MSTTTIRIDHDALPDQFDRSRPDAVAEVIEAALREDGIAAEVSEVISHLKIELPSDHRTGLQYPDTVSRESIEPLTNHFTDTVRHVETEIVATVAAEQSFLPTVTGQFLHEQRIAFAVPVNSPGQGTGRIPDPNGQIIANRITTDTGQGQTPETGQP